MAGSRGSEKFKFRKLMNRTRLESEDGESETQDFKNAPRQAALARCAQYAWKEPLYLVLRAQAASPGVSPLWELQGA